MSETSIAGKNEFPRIEGMVDVAMFTIYEERLCVALLPRPVTADNSTPYEGLLALPGAYIHPQTDMDTYATALRLLKNKAGIIPPYLEQLYTFTGALRDSRGWSISVVYYVVVPYSFFLEQSELRLVFVPVDQVPDLPFDHNDMVKCAVDRLQSKSAYSSLPMFLLGEEFTINELHKVYEQVMGVDVPMVTFRRKIEEQELIVPVIGKMKIGKHRPAQLYTRSSRALKTFNNTF